MLLSGNRSLGRVANACLLGRGANAYTPGRIAHASKMRGQGCLRHPGDELSGFHFRPHAEAIEHVMRQVAQA